VLTPIDIELSISSVSVPGCVDNIFSSVLLSIFTVHSNEYRLSIYSHQRSRFTYDTLKL
jgi:hypothetical protein